MNDDGVRADILRYLHGTLGLQLKVVNKTTSAFMWTLYVISFMWIWNRRFMTGYITTIGGKVYAPDGDVHWRTLAHEGVHAVQARRVGEPLFSLAYLFPLPLAVLALGAFGAFVCPWAWLCLLALAALAPFPAPWRVKYEREAYLMTAICDALVGVNITAPGYLSYQVENHCGWGYYKPSWNRDRMWRLVGQDVVRAKRLLAGEETDSYYTAVIAIVRARKSEVTL